jgi:hypothetical protein
MDILSEDSKKRMPKVSYSALKASRKTISARRLLLVKQDSQICLEEEEEVYVQAGPRRSSNG